ncbi:MAG: DUF456 domain-containing protein [Lentimicrobium sp.]|jgi:hypothetical protein|nr:DUF456 domain-containing protein [Lentimicrobium sp.]MDD2526534.1 DUF456 domain-containing protein [Lentimicrobiaceae bacterium]MDD4596332.1 DUF456 domain-containing protein [Lentimicrobiaceae bacterium]MDY0025545.1 DUF456 domain-containing protein [Lentimicrobium sp.]HAH58291.1 DUF456 domain-containing protein [Bacteroidales bacterium]
MEWLWITLGVVIAIAGIVGCILPFIPGPPLNYIALLLLHFTMEPPPFTTKFLMVWLAITVIVTLLDYYVPIWGTRKYGGSNGGVWGAAAGLLLGLIFFPPFGMIAGPFLGAVVGELLTGKNSSTALKAGFGSFVGFLAGVIMKLAVSIALTYHFFKVII